MGSHRSWQASGSWLSITHCAKQRHPSSSPQHEPITGQHCSLRQDRQGVIPGTSSQIASVSSVDVVSLSVVVVDVVVVVVVEVVVGVVVPVSSSSSSPPVWVVGVDVSLLEVELSPGVSDIVLGVSVGTLSDVVDEDVACVDAVSLGSLVVDVEDEVDVVGSDVVFVSAGVASSPQAMSSHKKATRSPTEESRQFMR